MKKHIPTIRDVAAAAGVSAATVSRYINGVQRFSPAVEASLQSVIAELDYQSNPLAQSMATGRTMTIGVSVPDIGNPHFSTVVRGANRIALEHGYTVLLVDFNETPAREKAILNKLRRRVDGLLLYSRVPEAEQGWMEDLQTPVVFFGRRRQPTYPYVGTDDERGGYMLASHLVALGHTRFSYLGFSASPRDAERIAGIAGCLRQHGLELTCHDTATNSTLEGERMSASIMLAPTRPDALIFFNDSLALGFMTGIRALGFRLPEDLSVASFDNIEYGKHVTPSLTTVDLQSEALGIAGMETLLAAIHGKPHATDTIIEARLVIRNSTITRRAP